MAFTEKRKRKSRKEKTTGVVTRAAAAAKKKKEGEEGKRRSSTVSPLSVSDQKGSSSGTQAKQPTPGLRRRRRSRLTHKERSDFALEMEENPDLYDETAWQLSGSGAEDGEDKIESPMGPCGPGARASESKAAGSLVHNIFTQDELQILWAKDTKRRPMDYMYKQTDLCYKMRTILVDWLVLVGVRFKLHDETLLLGTMLLDAFLAKRAVKRTNLQLVGCTALYVASKFEEIYAPEVRDFIYISDECFTYEQLLTMEEIMLDVLEYRVRRPTSLLFLGIFLQQVEKGLKDTEGVQFLAESLLQHMAMDKFFITRNSSERAAIALFLTVWTLRPIPREPWTPALVKITRATSEELIPDARHLREYIKKLPGTDNAVYKKYSRERMQRVSMYELRSP